jgi:hypothetical protein
LLFILPPFCSTAFDFTFKKQKREDEEGNKDAEKGKVMNWAFSTIFVTSLPHPPRRLKGKSTL